MAFTALPRKKDGEGSPAAKEKTLAKISVSS
jgi:hypothetical protein